MQEADRACHGRLPDRLQGLCRELSIINATIDASFLRRSREACDELVAALDGVVQRLLWFLFVGPYRFELLVDDVANLDEIAKADAARVVRRLHDHLLH